MTQPAGQAALFAYIDQQRLSYINRLLAYVRQPSISAHGIGIAETADFLLARLQALGMDAQLMPTAGWPMVLGRRFDAPRLYTNCATKLFLDFGPGRLVARAATTASISASDQR